MIMPYFRESFKYQPIQLFLNLHTADVIQSCGDITYNLRRKMFLPPGTIGCMALRELTTLVFMVSHFIQEAFAKFAAAMNIAYHGIRVALETLCYV